MTYPNVVALQSKAHRQRIRSRGLNQMSGSSAVTLPAPLVENTKGGVGGGLLDWMEITLGDGTPTSLVRFDFCFLC